MPAPVLTHLIDSPLMNQKPELVSAGFSNSQVWPWARGALPSQSGREEGSSGVKCNFGRLSNLAVPSLSRLEGTRAD